MQSLEIIYLYTFLISFFYLDLSAQVFFPSIHGRKRGGRANRPNLMSPESRNVPVEAFDVLQGWVFQILLESMKYIAMLTSIDF